MKIKLLILTLLMSLNLPTIAQQYDKGIARVQKNNGLYVFSDNEPLAEYDIIERQKSIMSWTGQYNEVRNKLIRKTVKDNPEADGIVITMALGTADKAVVIKFKEGQDKDLKELTRVHKSLGIYLFTDCEPVNDYEVLARVKSIDCWSGQYQAVRDKLIRRATRKYPNAEGMIFTFTTGGTDRAAVIKFK